MDVQANVATDRRKQLLILSLLRQAASAQLAVSIALQHSAEMKKYPSSARNKVRASLPVSAKLTSRRLKVASAASEVNKRDSPSVKKVFDTCKIIKNKVYYYKRTSRKRKYMHKLYTYNKVDMLI